MALRSSAGKELVDKELADMTECSICKEVFTNPRVLPCIHTFCLKCLLNYGKDKRPGDRLPCPLCRKEFTIPDDGLSGTQNNFFMDNLLRLRKLSAGQEVAVKNDDRTIAVAIQNVEHGVAQCNVPNQQQQSRPSMQDVTPAITQQSRDDGDHCCSCCVELTQLIALL